jgi:hypothetical protein
MPPTQTPKGAPESLQDPPTPIVPSPPTAPTTNLRSQGEFYMTGVTPISSDSTADEECTICLEKLTNDVVKMEACDHHFHAMCILAWFERSAPRSGKKKGRCPNCRHELYEPDPRPAPLAMAERETISQDQLAQNFDSSSNASASVSSRTPSLLCCRRARLFGCGRRASPAAIADHCRNDSSRADEELSERLL